MECTQPSKQPSINWWLTLLVVYVRRHLLFILNHYNTDAAITFELYCYNMYTPVTQ